VVLGIDDEDVVVAELFQEIADAWMDAGMGLRIGADVGRFVELVFVAERMAVFGNVFMGTSKNAFARSRWHCCCTPAS